MDGEFPALKVNRRRIYQIFANLVNNAVKFMDPNNPSPYVRVSCADLGEFYEFRVKDNGPGIDPRYHKKVFGVFQRLHGREVEGTGIGLAFVKKIVDRMGGIIWIESELGKGAEFIFTLPKPE
jgi:signal transduction histidine kinase